MTFSAPPAEPDSALPVSQSIARTMAEAGRLCPDCSHPLGRHESPPGRRAPRAWLVVVRCAASLAGGDDRCGCPARFRFSEPGW